MDFTIVCPKCGTKIDLSKRISDFVQQQTKKETQEYRKKLDRDKDKEIREAEKSAADKAREDERAKAGREKNARVKDYKLLQEKYDQVKKGAVDMAKKEAKKMAAQIVAEKMSEVRSTHEEELTDRELENKELKKQLKDTKGMLQEAQTKIAEGSAQVRGIIAEEDLFQYLKKNLPTDRCHVKKIGQGKKGTDVIVYALRNGEQIGSIIIDSKWAGKWDKSWPEKVWGDMQDHDANFAYIAAKACAMPDEIKDAGFGLAPCRRAGVRVWVIDANNLPLLSGILLDSIDKIINIAEIKAMYGTGSKPLKQFQEYLSNRYELDLREKAKQMSIAVKSLNDMYKKVQSEYEKTKEALEKYWITESKVHQSIATCFDKGAVKALPQIKELN